MIEIPEAIVLSQQLDQSLKGKRVVKTLAAVSPHKFTWYSGDPACYGALTDGKTVLFAASCAGRVELCLGDVTLRFLDGVNLRLYAPDKNPPTKHQLFTEFDDGSTLVATVAMYGGIMCIPKGEPDDDKYTLAAKNAPPPLSDVFDYAYFISLLDDKCQKLSAKAFLATEQRIPGLGNGVLQDILLNARVHPKTKMNTLSSGQLHTLFDSIKATLKEMTDGGGRDTERDLFGNFGRYRTKLSKNSLPYPCQNCGGIIRKEAYLGGSIYYCESCQIKQ